MSREYIPVSEIFEEWRKDPEYVAAYDALEEEFALAEALIRARAHADMTQEQVAKAMGTTQAAIARLESGRSMPSTRTLQRFAEATGTRLRVSFVPGKDTSKAPAKAKRPAARRKTAAKAGKAAAKRSSAA
ncbi:MAG: helix-turn-helix transcriptional regulator [Rhizobiales bacterium]|jgi:transcriptional regulator with XRE-family HTH domain|nr:helix-turn-helix transcriptional regulator [Hyphomicrobiales bacterium]